jgi:hypothetical protein
MNDNEFPCPKCGSTVINIEYINERKWWSFKLNPKLKIWCDKCKYIWGKQDYKIFFGYMLLRFIKMYKKRESL